MDPNLDLDEVIDMEIYSNSWESLTDRELLEITEAPKERSF